ncbi:MAG TPA: hypothetical protein PKI11_01265 [Candidatus Hydrogenedentes bacterium]|nr:hypothetical protein [Candidatus Hydrogenedentota bacterium]
MSFRCNLLWACALVLLASPVSAVDDDARLESRKAEVVRAALAHNPAAGDVARLLAAAADAEALTDITLTSGRDSEMVRLTVSGDPACDAFALDGGRRIVLDLLNVVNLHSGKILRPAAPSLIESVRTSLYTIEPQITSRVVIDLTRPTGLRIEQADECLRVYGGSASPSGEAPPLLAEVAFAGGKDKQADPDSDLAPLGADLRALREHHEATPEHPETMVENATPPTAQEPAPSEVMAPQPPTEATVPNSLAFELAALRRIRAGASAPSLAEDMRLVAAARPNIRLGDILLSAAVGEEMAETAQDAEAPAEEPAQDVEDAAPEDAAPEEAPEEPEEAADVIEEPPPARPEVVEPDLAEANVALTERLRALEELADAGAPPDALAPPAPVRPARPTYQGNPLDMPVNLDFRDMDMANVVAILASMADINVIAGTDLSGTVTLSLKDVPLRQAIQTVLRINGLGMVHEEGFIGSCLTRRRRRQNGRRCW